MAWARRADFQHRRADWARLVEYSFAGTAAAGACATFFAELYERFAQPTAWRVFDEVCPALRRLRERRLRLGVISNWDERLRPLLQSLGLDEFFHSIVISHDIGFQKPAPQIFGEACRQLGIDADSILHVGDSRTEDVSGAKAAGMQAVWVNRTGAGEGIHSLAELLNENIG